MSLLLCIFFFALHGRTLHAVVGRSSCNDRDNFLQCWAVGRLRTATKQKKGLRLFYASSQVWLSFVNNRDGDAFFHGKTKKDNQQKLYNRFSQEITP